MFSYCILHPCSLCPSSCTPGAIHAMSSYPQYQAVSSRLCLGPACTHNLVKLFPYPSFAQTQYTFLYFPKLLAL